MPQVTTILSYGDKKTLLAAALGIREWNIMNDGLTDNEVVYELSDTTTNYKGLYKRSYTIGENNKVTLGTPNQVFRRTSYEPLVVVGLFSMDDAEVCFASDGTVLRTGKIFEAGDYPDKGFSITEEQLARVPATFTPVNNDLEHKPTILSGKIGQLRSVVAKGKELFGTVAIPKWLNDTIGKDPLKVSLAWTKDSKQIIGNALVLNPRIPDAQLMAAFSAANTTTPEGGTLMKVKEAIDRIKAHFSKSGVPEELKDIDLDKVDFTDDAPAPAPAPAVVAPPVPATAPANFSADLQARDTKIEQLETELAAKAAAEFADNAIKEGKAFPAERESLVAMFAQARKDDGAGLACFAADGKTPTTRVAALEAAINARPSHNLTAEQISGLDPKNPQLVVLGNTTQFAKDAERPTPDGQKISTEREQRLAQFSNIQEAK